MIARAPRDDEPIIDFWTKRYAPVKLLGCSPHTKFQYTTSIRKFGEHLGRTAMLSDLTDESVSGYLAAIFEAGAAPATVNTIRKQFVAIWRFACAKGWGLDLPNIKRVVEPNRNPEAWTVEELARLYRSCAMQPGKLCGVPAARWWVAIHLFWFDSGERKTAALMMRWDQVSFERGGVMVPAEHRKGGKDDRWYPLKPATLEALKAIEKPERELVFPWPGHPTSLYNHYHKILKRAGLSTGRLCGPHKMRRSHATHLEVAIPGAATASLGHANRACTVRSYLDRRLVKGIEAAKHLPDVALPTRAEPVPHLTAHEIRAAMNSAGLSIKAFAELAGLNSPSHLSHILSGKTIVTAKVDAKIREALKGLGHKANA